MGFLKRIQLFNCDTAINTITPKAFKGCKAEETLNQMLLVKYTNLMLRKQTFDWIEIPAHHCQIFIFTTFNYQKVVPDLRLTHDKSPGFKLQ